MNSINLIEMNAKHIFTTLFVADLHYDLYHQCSLHTFIGFAFTKYKVKTISCSMILDVWMLNPIYHFPSLFELAADLKKLVLSSSLVPLIILFEFIEFIWIEVDAGVIGLAIRC